MQWDPLEHKLAASWPSEQWKDVTVVVAASGGLDSTALVVALSHLKGGGAGKLVVAHFNHRLRGDESDQDQRFVESLSRRLGLPFETQSADTDRFAVCSGDGLEGAARAARYAFLERTAGCVGARYIAIAHTADDQAETILHRVLRGTGIAGLSGMARVRPLGPATLIRPLLVFRREELAAYLARLGQPYRVDQTNQVLRFTRNRIRHELLPLLTRQYNPMVADALLRLGTLAGEVQTIIARWVEQFYVEAVRQLPAGSVRIDPRPLARSEPYLLRELLIAVWRRQGWPEQAMGYRQWDLLAEMLRSAGEQAAPTPTKRVFPGAVLAEVCSAGLQLSCPSGVGSLSPPSAATSSSEAPFRDST